MTQRTALEHESLRRFAGSVTAKFVALAAGEPEDQLRAPLETLLANMGRAFGVSVIAKGESRLPNRQGKPDYAVVVNGLLAGYVELKAPGAGARPNRFRGHDREQWKRFRTLPNILYSDGNEWGLYCSGQPAGPVVQLAGDVTTDGEGSVTDADAEAVGGLIERFFAWEPLIPSTAELLAELLAPLCRALREDVGDALTDTDSPLVHLAAEWRALLFPNASDEQFADAYAQTVTYGLLLARSAGASTLSIPDSVAALRSEHSLLAKAIEVLTMEQVQVEISTSLHLLQRVIDRVDTSALATGVRDLWLYFYEDFLGKYDPDLRRDAGVYYTPVEVVHAQVNLIDEILTDRLGLRLGFAESEVVTLDPAVGTGTYLLGVIEHALERVEALEGPGAVPGRGKMLAANIHGFEIMVGAYAVAELRLNEEFAAYGVDLSGEPPQVYLTDTLESPATKPVAPPLFYAPLAREHERALRVKEAVPVLVCLGNPPYDRHVADDTTKGGWVRHGAEGERAILDDFVTPARDAGFGVHLKNLYNLYVYFWRWALWKVFEHETATGPGVISFISASSYLRGPAFLGMREHIRRECDEVWVIDLGGEGRGARQTENIFSILTPVAVALAVRYGERSPDDPAVVHYTSIEGTRPEKLEHLDRITELDDLAWEDCPSGWHDPFLPVGTGDYFDWPSIVDLFPWQHSGVQVKRTWPISPDPETLHRRWAAMLASPDRATAFRETDRKVTRQYSSLEIGTGRQPSIASLPSGEPTPAIKRYGHRSFDRQWVIADNRLGDRMRPVLWRTHSSQQLYLASSLSAVLGSGPALMASADIPDLHFFSGRGAKDIIPLWRDSEATEPNLLPGLLDTLSEHYGHSVSAENFCAYCYGVLAHPQYVRRFTDELPVPSSEGSGRLGPRVPISLEPDLFAAARDIGRELLWLHTFSRQFVPDGAVGGGVPTGVARCVHPVPDSAAAYPNDYRYEADAKALNIGDGLFSPVEPEVWNFEVSGLRVIESWLGYRMRDPSGRRSSPLDEINAPQWRSEFTTELLELLWILEATVSVYPRQADLLDAILGGPLMRADDLPPVPNALRTPLDTSRRSVEQLEH